MSVEAGVLDDGFDRTGTLATVGGAIQQLPPNGMHISFYDHQEVCF